MVTYECQIIYQICFSLREEATSNVISSKDTTQTCSFKKFVFSRPKLMSHLIFWFSLSNTYNIEKAPQLLCWKMFKQCRITKKLESYIFPSAKQRCWHWLQAISLAQQTTASKFLHSWLVDQLYAKEVDFCSFVLKSNQIFTKMYLAVSIGPSHMESSKWFSTPPYNTLMAFPHISLSYRNSSFCCLSIFSSLELSKLPPKDT